MTFKKLLILILLAAPFVYAYQKRPNFEQHLTAIYAAAAGEGAAERDDLATLPQWEQLRYRDFYIVTTTSDVDQMNLVSYGYFGRVRLADDQWGPKAFGLVPPKD